MADDGIGSVSVSVTPDATDFWRRFEAATRPDADRTGAKLGAGVRRGMQTELDRGATVRVKADTARARTELAALNEQANRAGKAGESSGGLLLRSALALGPALVPIVAAAATGGAEFAAMGAAGILAIKGIQAEIARGTPTGEQYALVIHTLKGSLSELEATASKGVLTGFEQSAGKLRGDLPQLNSVISEQSRLLGDVASHVTGGLVGGFSTFAPVLNQIGGSIDRIAAHFEAWATGPGGAAFSKTLSSDYAQVAPIIEDIVSAVSHLVAASHGVGLGILSELGLLARVLDSFPTPVLTAVLAGLIAFRQIREIGALITSASAAFPLLAARSQAAAAAVTYANAQVRADEALTAAAFAAAEAEKAEAAAAGAAATYGALAGTGSVLEDEALIAATAASEFAAAMAAEAAAATATAEEIAVSASAAAEASVAAGAEASIGWSAMLGPLGIVAGAVGILGLSFLGSSNDTQQATASIQGYTSALVQSKNAIDGSVRAQVAKKLSDEGALEAAKQLGISQSQLVSAITNGGPALDAVNKKLATYGSTAEATSLKAAKLIGFSPKEEAKDPYVAVSLALEQEAKNFAAATQAARDQQAAVDGGSAAVRRQAAALHVSATAYLDAQTAAKKNTDQARQQTLAWQLENDAGSLLQQTLDKLAGKQLSYAQAQNAFQQQLVTLAQNLQGGSKAVTGLTAAAIQNRGTLLSLVQGAEQTAGAYGTMRGSSEAARQKLIELRAQIIDNAVAHGEDRDAVTRFVDSLLKIPRHIPPTRIDLLGVDLAIANAKSLASWLNSLHNKTITVTEYNANRLAAKGYFTGASGGTVPGAPSRVDSVHAMLAPGEEVISAFQADKHRPLLKAINAGVQGYAAGGTVGSGPGIVTIPPPKSSKASSSSASSSASNVSYIVAGQSYASLRSAENAAARLFKANVKLGVTIDHKDLDAFKRSLTGTAQQVHAAFSSMIADAQKLGISSTLAKTLRAENRQLDAEVSARNKAAAALKRATDKWNAAKNAVSSATSGAYDVTQAGRSATGQGGVTFGAMYAQAEQQANIVKKWDAGIRKLAKEGLAKSATGRGLLTQLAEGGPGDWPQVQALLSASPDQLAKLVSTDHQINSAGTDLGKFIGNTDYGKTIRDDKAEVAADNRRIDRLADKIGRQLERAVDRLDKRPIVIKVGDKVVARVTATGASKNARRK